MSKKSHVISVLNMKGGVGKTTLAANVFREVFRVHQKSTLLIDLDPQFNLSQMLLTKRKYEHLRDNEKTIFQIMEQPQPKSIFDVAQNKMLEPPDSNEISHGLYYFPDTPEIKLDLIAGDFRLVRFNLRDDTDSLEVPRKRFKNFIEASKKYYDFIVLDCNPSSSFLTRNAIENATDLFIPVRPDRYSVLGITIIQEFMDIILPSKQQPKLSIIINDIRYKSPPGEVESQIRSDKIYGPACLTARIPTSSLLRLEQSQVGFATDKRVAYKKRVENCLVGVANELIQKLGVKS